MLNDNFNCDEYYNYFNFYKNISSAEYKEEYELWNYVQWYDANTYCNCPIDCPQCKTNENGNYICTNRNVSCSYRCNYKDRNKYYAYGYEYKKGEVA